MSDRNGFRMDLLAIAGYALVLALGDLAVGQTLHIQIVAWICVLAATAPLAWPQLRNPAAAAGGIVVAGLLLFSVSGSGVAPLVFVWSGVLQLFWSGARIARRPWPLMTVSGLFASILHVLGTTVLPGTQFHSSLVYLEIAAIGWFLYHAFAAPYLRLQRDSQTARVVVSRMEREHPSSYGISSSRLRVLRHLCLYSHKTNADLAVALGLSRRTVERYVSELLAITGVDNRRQLVALFEYHYLSEEARDERPETTYR
jgi:hypothetical protein